ncbi:MAG: hypothetical protein ACOYNF_05885 [Rhodoferax sp.]
MQTVQELFNRDSTTSLELVALLNALRPADEPRLRHHHFMRKVRKVLGEAGIKKAATARRGERPNHLFTRREGCLMVMSYGTDLQAAVFDLAMSRAAK